MSDNIRLEAYRARYRQTAGGRRVRVYDSRYLTLALQTASVDTPAGAKAAVAAFAGFIRGRLPDVSFEIRIEPHGAHLPPDWLRRAVIDGSLALDQGMDLDVVP